MSCLTKDTKILTHLKTSDPAQRIEVWRYNDRKKVWYGVKFCEWQGSSKDGRSVITHQLDVEEEDFHFIDNTIGLKKVHLVEKKTEEE